jgi:hypothetical protein
VTENTAEPPTDTNWGCGCTVIVGAVGGGGGCAVTVKTAAALVTEPAEFVTTTENESPFSFNATVASVSVDELAAAILVPVRRHWYCSGAVPDAVIEKLAEAPSMTD